MARLLEPHLMGRIVRHSCPPHGWIHDWGSPFLTRIRYQDSTKMHVCRHLWLGRPQGRGVNPAFWSTLGTMMSYNANLIMSMLGTMQQSQPTPLPSVRPTAQQIPQPHVQAISQQSGGRIVSSSEHEMIARAKTLIEPEGDTYNILYFLSAYIKCVTMQFNITWTLFSNIICVCVTLFQVQAPPRCPETYWRDHQGEVPRRLANLGRSSDSASRLMVCCIQGACFRNRVSVTDLCFIHF